MGIPIKKKQRFITLWKYLYDHDVVIKNVYVFK